MIEIVKQPWIQIGLLLAAPPLAKYLANLLHLLFDRRISLQCTHKGQTAGLWIQTQIANVKELACIQVVSQAGVYGQIDAYWPSAKVLLLRPSTFHSTNIGAFHIAAHELGHATIHTNSPVAGLIFRGARFGQVLTGHLLIACIFARLCGASSISSLSLHSLFAAMIFCHIAVLVDEGLASLHAHQLIKKAAPTQASGFHLLSAWLGYFFPALARLIQWALLPTILVSQVPNLSHEMLPFVFDSTLFLAILSLMLAKRSITLFRKLKSPILRPSLSEQRRRQKKEGLGSLAGALGVVTFVFFVAPTAPNWAVILALLPVSWPLSALGDALFGWPFRKFLGRFAPPLYSATSQNSDRAHPPSTEAPSSLFAGASSFRRLFAVIQASFLPLLIFWWIRDLAGLSL